MRKLIPLFAICLFIAVCVWVGVGAPTPGGSGKPGATTPGATTPPHYDVETGADKLILRIASGGGLLPPGYVLTIMPRLALYGDGRIIVPGPVAEVNPRPLLPNLLVMRVTPAEIQTILAAADEAGLLGPDAHYDATNIFDGDTTTFTTIVGGKKHAISAYALFELGTTEDAAVTAARAKLSKFRDHMFDLTTFLGRPVSDAEAYVPTVMRVFTRLADAPDPTASAVQTVAWPLSLDPATASEPTTVLQIRCIPLSGTDLASFQAVARTANTTTLWTYGAVRYAVSVRPLYPDEIGCPGIPS